MRTSSTRMEYCMGVRRKSPQPPVRQQLTCSQITHRLSVLCAQLKLVTVTQACAHFKDLSHERQKELLEEDEYWYKLTPVSLNYLRQRLQLTCSIFLEGRGGATHSILEYCPLRDLVPRFV